MTFCYCEPATKRNSLWIIHEFKQHEKIFSFFSRCHSRDFPSKMLFPTRKTFLRAVWDVINVDIYTSGTFCGWLHSIIFDVILSVQRKCKGTSLHTSVKCNGNNEDHDCKRQLYERGRFVSYDSGLYQSGEKTTKQINCKWMSPQVVDA